MGRPVGGVRGGGWEAVIQERGTAGKKEYCCTVNVKPRREPTPATGDLTLESHVDFRCLSCSEGAFCFPVETVTKRLYRGLSFTDRSGWWVDRDSPIFFLSHDNCTGSRLPTTLSIGNDKLYAAFRLAVRLCSIFFSDVQGRVLLRSPQTFRV